MERRVLARAAGAGGDLVLSECDDGRLELRAGGVFVMDDAETDSERALAESALARVNRPSVVLVGGLGLGFTARAVLADERVQRVVIAEIEAELVQWTAEDRVPGGAALLADSRIEVRIGDVVDQLGEPGEYDVILLDVDNGPDFLVHAENARVYGLDVLGRCARSLRAGGVVALWSASRSPALTRRLGEVFACVEEVPLAVSPGNRNDEYWLYLGGALSTVSHGAHGFVK